MSILAKILTITAIFAHQQLKQKSWNIEKPTNGLWKCHMKILKMNTSFEMITGLIKQFWVSVWFLDNMSCLWQCRYSWREDVSNWQVIPQPFVCLDPEILQTSIWLQVPMGECWATLEILNRRSHLPPKLASILKCPAVFERSLIQ